MNKIIIANWKMNPQSQKDAGLIFKGISKDSKNIKNNKVIVCPPFPFLFIASKFKSKKVFLGSQNVSSKPEGSYTGEVSPKMLLAMGVKYSIVGHSERRKMGEDNTLLNEKILNLLKYKISPILCIGENKRDHDGFYLSFVSDQIKHCLSAVPKNQMKNVIIAYEPVWAIGKDATREATKEEFIEMKIFIKKVINDMYGEKVAHSIPILYGGSVNKDNAKIFIEEGGADGLLVGRDSLNTKKFSAIISAVN
jgi:triosephosphate isomerase